MSKPDYKRCSRGLWDTSVPGIEFDQNGVSNYAKMFDRLIETYPRGDVGKNQWEKIVEEAKRKGKGKKYDCIIGVSGGTDSSYLLHLAKVEYGLRPLAVNLDNGWSSDIAVKNIKKITNQLDIDLETYVIDYEEIKDLLRCYMYASLPWIDLPTDLAIKSIMFRYAAQEGISLVLRGNDFRSEGFQPQEWTLGDGKQLSYIHNKFGKVKLRTFPNYTFSQLVYYSLVKGIKNHFPFYYLEYQKQDAQDLLKKEYGWEYYGGHHHENLFTKFAISYWLYEKFSIDKRIITLSAQILSGAITREDGLLQLVNKPYEEETLSKDLEFFCKKLDLSLDEFKHIMSLPNKEPMDYPSYYPLMKAVSKYLTPIISLFYPYKPMSVFQIEMRKNNP